MAARRLFMTHMESQKADRVTVAAAAHDGHMTEDNFERFLRFRLNAMCKILNKTLGKRVRRKHFLARGDPGYRGRGTPPPGTLGYRGPHARKCCYELFFDPFLMVLTPLKF